MKKLYNKKFSGIYESIKQDILEKRFSYGDQLPSENKLSEIYSTSRETVRKALSLLVEEGMIQKIRGKGSVVIHQNVTEFFIGDLISFNEVQQTLYFKYNTEVKLIEKIYAHDVPKVKNILNVDSSTMLWHIIRTRKMGDNVKIIDEDFLIENIIPNITESIAMTSLYKYIEDYLCLEISYSNKSITFEPFNTIEYKFFGNVNPPYTATVRSIIHLKDTRKFQYNISRHLATEFKFNDFSRRNNKFQ